MKLELMPAILFPDVLVPDVCILFVLWMGDFWTLPAVPGYGLGAYEIVLSQCVRTENKRKLLRVARRRGEGEIMKITYHGGHTFL